MSQQQELLMPHEEKLRRLMDVFTYTRWGIVIGDVHNRNFKHINPAFAEMHGYTVEELMGRPILDVFAPESHAHTLDMIRQANEKGRCTFEAKNIKKDGTVFPTLIDLTAIRDENGNLLHRIGNVLDITELKKAAEERDRFFELSIDMLCIAGTDGYFKRINPAFSQILGYTNEELLTRPFFDFVHPDDLYTTLNETEKLRQGIATVEFDNRYRCKDGSYKWISWHCQPHPTGALYAVARDITKERETQKSIRASLKEKEVLLKEIHHRVKNNLQVIISLINMQIRKLDAITAKDALLECQSRIQAIALIHEKLYQSTDYGNVTFSEYAESLVNDIFRALGTSNQDIAPRIDIADMSISIDKAIPCALIMNELVTNSVKHAFPNSARGTIQVSMRPHDNKSIQLKIQDNGVGIPENFDLKKTKSLGLQLVNTLVSQLNAKIFIDQIEGTCFTIQFPR